MAKHLLVRNLRAKGLLAQKWDTSTGTEFPLIGYWQFPFPSLSHRIIEVCSVIYLGLYLMKLNLKSKLV